MTEFPDENDERVVSFLKQYRPLPPPPSPNLEGELMRRIERKPIAAKSSAPLLWIIPGVITVCVALVWSSSRWFNPSPKIAAHPEELEAFLIDTWTGVMEETPSSFQNSQNQSSEITWLTLAEP